MPAITETQRVPRSISEKQNNDISSAHVELLEHILESDVVGFVGNPLNNLCELLPQRVQKLVLISPQKEELAAAQKKFKKFNNIVYVHESISKLRIEPECLDVLVSKNVLEFEAKALESFEELSDKLKNGGLIWLEENDNSHLSHYPLACHLESQLLEIAEQLHRNNKWDPWVGRKLFSFLSESNFKRIETKILEPNLIYGCSNQEDQLFWPPLFDRLQGSVNTGEIKLKFDLKCFRQEISAFFDNPHRFSYSPLIQIMARKAE